MPSRPDPALKQTNFQEYQRQAREWREYISNRQGQIDDQLKYGASLSDLGIFNQPEMGRAGWQRRMVLNSNQGFQDPNWTFDWVNGVKYHTGTSDETQHGVAVPISAQEQREFQNQQRYGTYEGSYVDRMQADQRAWLERAAAEGQLTRDPRFPNYYWDGENKYFDRFGAVVNPQTGQRTGGAYGDDGWNPSFQGGAAGQGWQGGAGGPGGAGGAPGGPGGAGGGSGYGGYSSNGLLFGSPSLEGLAANEASISAELAKQGRLDTLGKLFEYSRAADQYNTALPQQQYLRDFYGSILGVNFNPSEANYGNWFSQGVNQQGSYQGGTPGWYPGMPYNPAQQQGAGQGTAPDPNGQAQVGPGGLPNSPIRFQPGPQAPPPQQSAQAPTGPSSPMAPAAPVGPSSPLAPSGAPSGAAPSLMSLSGYPTEAGRYPTPDGPPPQRQTNLPVKPGPRLPPQEPNLDVKPGPRLPPEEMYKPGQTGVDNGGVREMQPPGYLGPPTTIPPVKGKGDREIPNPQLPPRGGYPGRINDVQPLTQGVSAQYIPGQVRPVMGTPVNGATQGPSLSGAPTSDPRGGPSWGGGPTTEAPPTLSGLMKPNKGNLPTGPGQNDMPPGQEMSLLSSEGWAGQGAGVAQGDPASGAMNGLIPKTSGQASAAMGGGSTNIANMGGGGGPGEVGGTGVNPQTGFANEQVPPALWYAWVPWLRAHPGGTFYDFLSDQENEPALTRWITDQQNGGQSPNGYWGSVQEYFQQQPGYNGNQGYIPYGYPGSQAGQQQQWYRPISPDLPQAPQFDKGSYSLSGDSYNPMDSSTWGFLAKPANQIATDSDNAAEQIRRTMPAGGARDKALAQLAQGKFAGVAGLRQDLVNSALSGISGLTETGLGYSPGSLTGGAQSLGNIFSNKYSTDANSATNNANLAENKRQFDITQQNQQRQSRSNLFGGLAQGLGTLFGSMFGGPAGGAAGGALTGALFGGGGGRR